MGGITLIRGGSIEDCITSLKLVGLGAARSGSLASVKGLTSMPGFLAYPIGWLQALAGCESAELPGHSGREEGRICFGCGIVLEHLHGVACIVVKQLKQSWSSGAVHMQLTAFNRMVGMVFRFVPVISKRMGRGLLLR